MISNGIGSRAGNKCWSCHSLILIIPCLGYPTFNILFQFYNFHPHTWWTTLFSSCRICLNLPFFKLVHQPQSIFRPDGFSAVRGQFLVTSGPLNTFFFHGGPTKHSPHLLVKSAGGWYPRFLSVFQGTWLSWWVPQRARSRYWSLELTKQHIRIAYRRFWH